MTAVLKSKVGGPQISSANRKSENYSELNILLNLRTFGKCESLRICDLRTQPFCDLRTENFLKSANAYFFIVQISHILLRWLKFKHNKKSSKNTRLLNRINKKKMRICDLRTCGRLEGEVCGCIHRLYSLQHRQQIIFNFIHVHRWFRIITCEDCSILPESRIRKIFLQILLDATVCNDHFYYEGHA